MSNDANQSNIELSAEQEVVQPALQEAAGDQVETKEDVNWKNFREGRKKDRLEKEAAMREKALAEQKAREKEQEVMALKAALEASLDKRPANSYQHNEYFQEEETEQTRIEKAVQAAIVAREQKYERDRVEREQQEYPAKLQKDFSDFNTIVSEENLDYLEYHYPEIASPLKRLGDNYDKWSDIYRVIKKYVPNAKEAKRDAARVDNNLMRPKSMSAVGSTQSTEQGMTGRLSEERKQQNWERMQRQLKGLT